MIMTLPVCYIGYIGIPDQRHNVRVVHSKLERDKIEVDELSCRPKLVKTQQQNHVVLNKLNRAHQ